MKPISSLNNASNNLSLALKQAQQNDLKHNYEKNVTLLWPLYEENYKSGKKIEQKYYQLLVILLTKALFNINKLDLLNLIIEDNIPVFLMKKSSFQLVFKIMLKNNLFLSAHKFIRLSAKYNYDTKKELNELEEKEQKYKTKEAVNFRNNLFNFYNVANSSRKRQKEVLKAANRIPLNDFIKASKYVLNNPTLAPSLQSYILDNLKQLDYQGVITTYRIDLKSEKVRLAALPTINALKSWQAIQQIITSDFEQDNPILANQLFTSLKSLVFLFYPFTDEIITKPKAWVNFFAKQMYGEKTANSVVNQTIKQWQTRLQERVNKSMDNK